MKVAFLILAGGKGTRLKQDTPKALVKIANTPLLGHILDKTQQLGFEVQNTFVITGYKSQEVQKYAENYATSIFQAKQLGTGHALKVALPFLKNFDFVLVLSADTPFVSLPTLQRLIDAPQDMDLVVGSVNKLKPFGYGRVCRNKEGLIEKIVEEKDANPQQKAITEVNTGIYRFSIQAISPLLCRLTAKNSQNEYYLTDLVELAVQAGKKVDTLLVEDEFEAEGINDLLQLAELESEYHFRQAAQAALAGLQIQDLKSCYFEGKLSFGRNCSVGRNVVFRGEVRLGDGVRIADNVIIENSSLGDGTAIHPMSLIENSEIGANCSLGPFARLRPDNQLGDSVKIGCFVELKKATIGNQSKANHLAYIGDAEIGSGVNLGAGTITCNYDGEKKHKTTLSDGCFIGSNSSLVAPVSLAAGTFVGAGSVVTKDVVDEKQLVVTRSPQKTYPRRAKK